MVSMLRECRPNARRVALTACMAVVLHAGCASREPPVRQSSTPNSAAASNSPEGSEPGFDVSMVPGRIHRVETGDTLWSLAQNYYGDSRHWRRILSANRNRIRQPSDLDVGMKLIIP